jgi:prolipoprotein diacylglyceryltransferase
MLYIGCVVGIFAGAAVAGAEGLSEARFATISVALLVPALVGARVLFVLQHQELFRANSRRLWRRSEGGSALYGGFLLSLVVSVPVLRLAELPFRAYWDGATLTMLVGLIFTRVGCLMHGCCAGKPTDGRVGMWLPNEGGEWQRRFPTQLVEAGWTLVLVALALAAHPSLPFDGALFGVLVAGYAAGRLILERTRETCANRRANANLACSAALLLAACGLLIWGWSA